MSQSYGGVGRNLADCLSRLEYNPVFLSAVGNDSHSSAMSGYCGHMVRNMFFLLLFSSKILIIKSVVLLTMYHEEKVMA